LRPRVNPQPVLCDVLFPLHCMIVYAYTRKGIGGAHVHGQPWSATTRVCFSWSAPRRGRCGGAISRLEKLLDRAAGANLRTAWLAFGATPRVVLGWYVVTAFTPVEAVSRCLYVMLFGTTRAPRARLSHLPNRVSLPAATFSGITARSHSSWAALFHASADG